MTAAPVEKVNFVTRTARTTDEPFLFNTFLKSFRESDRSEGIPNTEFFQTFKAQFERVLETFTVLVAHPEGDEDEIAGWLAHQGDVVAWVYTKKNPWRRTGAGRALFAAAGLGTEIRALYASRWALALAKSKGLAVRQVSFVEGTRLLIGKGGS